MASSNDLILVTLDGSFMLPGDDYVLDADGKPKFAACHRISYYSVIQVVNVTRGTRKWYQGTFLAEMDDLEEDTSSVVKEDEEVEAEEETNFKYLVLWTGEPQVYDTLEEVWKEAKFSLHEHFGGHNIDNLEEYLNTKERERDYQKGDADIRVYAISEDNEVYLPVKDWVAEYKAEFLQDEKDEKEQEYQRYLELHEKYKNYKTPGN